MLHSFKLDTDEIDREREKKYEHIFLTPTEKPPKKFQGEKPEISDPWLE